MSISTKRRQALAVLEEVVDAIAHLDRPVIFRLAPVLHQAQVELESNLREWLAREDGAERFTAQRYRNALVAVRKASDAVGRIEPTLEAALWVGAGAAGELATEHVVRELEKFSEIFEGSVHPVSIDAAAVIARGQDLLIDRFETSAARYAGSVRDTVVQELAVSRVKSESIFELTNRLEKRLPEVFQGQRYAAARLARTETMNAYSVTHEEGLIEIAKDDPDILARWDASFDSRRCPMCASLDGQVRDVVHGESFDAEWTTVSKRRGVRQHHVSLKRPPGHPCCRCVSTPWRASWEDYSRPHTPAPPRERPYAGHEIRAASQP